MWRVHRIERDVEEERLVGRLLPEQAFGFAGNQVGAVALVAADPVVAVPVETAVAFMCKVVQRAAVMAVLVVEAARGREIGALITAQVPFPRYGSGVASSLENLRQHPFIQRQAPVFPGPDHADLQAVAHGVTARHQRGAGGRADRLDVELLQLCAGGGELINVRRLDILAAGEADIGVAKVVRQDDQDIGPALGGEGGDRDQRGTDEQDNSRV